MSRAREGDGDDGDPEGSEQRIVKKRKEVTTASILENFLLLSTSLDDTVREEDVARVLGEASSSSSSKGKGRKNDSSRFVYPTQYPLRTAENDE